MEERTFDTIQQDINAIFAQLRPLIDRCAQSAEVSSEDIHQYTLVMLRLLQLNIELTDLRLKAIEACLTALEHNRPDAAEPTR
jgi:hypothetical protein